MRRSSIGRAAVLALAVLAALLTVVAAQAVTNAAPANTAPPTITGTPTVGQTLTANDGTWTNTPTSYAYQWLRCNSAGSSCVKVANGTQKTYTLVGADAGHTMRVSVTATNADGSATARSAQTAAVAPATSGVVPKNTAAPTVTGTAKEGEILTADPGSWSGNPTSYTYQWQRCDADVASCFNVVGDTAKTYSVDATDVGYRLRVLVTAHNAKGSATAASAITAVVEPAVKITNHRPSVRFVSVRFVGATVYGRIRICDDSNANLSITETDSRPGKLSYTRHFATLAAPIPCGVYTRHWTPVSRFRGAGRYTVTIRVRDKSGLSSLPAARSFTHG